MLGAVQQLSVSALLLTTAMSLYIVHEARQLGAPAFLVARMLGNVAIDGVVGVVGKSSPRLINQQD
jgi:hypothetical protein